MKTLFLEGERILQLHEIERPLVEDGEVLVRVEVAGIGGSEYLGYNNPGIRPLPNIMGHGFTGVTADGRRVAIYPLQGCGECDYCADGMVQLCDDWHLLGVQSNGGFAQETAVVTTALVEIPETLTWEQSAFIEPFANSVNAWDLSGANEKTSIGIIGAGGLGLGVVACARDAGCQNIQIADLSSTRREAAQQLGATQSAARLNCRFDIVFDTVGSYETRVAAIDLAKKGGKCIFLGFATASLEINISELIRHQKQLLGSFVYSRDQFKKAITLVHRCDSAWVTNVSFAEVAPLLTAYLDGDFTVVKAALRPHI